MWADDDADADAVSVQSSDVLRRFLIGTCKSFASIVSKNLF